jgi:hypothetical protein
MQHEYLDIQNNRQLLANRNRERLLRMVQVIQSFSSSFTLRPISVKLSRVGSAPAFSDSNRIWFQENLVADLTTKAGVASLKGLTLHEISHILLSPRVGNEFRDWVIENKLSRAWNALEDQRIESQLIALYPSIRDWFIATMNQYLLASSHHYESAFPLVHGRKYLDKQVRKLARDMFVYPDRVAELEVIIDQFRALDMGNPDNYDTAKDLVLRYHGLTQDLEMENPHGHDSRPEDEHGTDINSGCLPRGKQTKASEDVEEDDSPYDDVDTDDDWDGEDEDGSGSDDETNDGCDGYGSGSGSDDEDEDGDGSGSGSDDEDKDGSGSGSDDEGNDGSNSGQDTPEGSSGSGKNTEELEQLQKELEDTLLEALDEVLDRLDDKLARDIDIYNGDVLLEGERLPDPPKYKYASEVEVSPTAVDGAEAFATELRRLRSQYDPAWNYRVETGRINPSRWEQGCDFEEAFDRYENGRADATDIEAVVLLDVSGSMGGMIRDASESMWAIKKALDVINATTSVVAYSDNAMTLYSPDERAKDTMTYIGTHGGTNPTKALQYAQGLFANSNRAVKLLIVITDGEWNPDALEKSEESIRNMRDGGVLTSLAWLTPYKIDLKEQNLHGAEVVCHVRNASDLVHLGRSLVEMAIARHLTY